MTKSKLIRCGGEVFKSLGLVFLGILVATIFIGLQHFLLDYCKISPWLLIGVWLVVMFCIVHFILRD